MEQNKSKTLYRKYRPQTFDEVIGQKNTIAILEKAIEKNQVNHAYLFSGSHGIGKTSIAKIFAHTLNKSLENWDNNLDIIEIDAASNNGVDEIRTLKENIKNLPIQSKYKIYIIDEIHMLSKSAFNALLKTLEEPPKYVIFIFATTEPQKIPLTILSRVQRHNFFKPTNSEVLNFLTKVSNLEGIKFENEALHLITRLANGSLRDALNLLEQSAIYCNNNLKIEKINDLFNITKNDVLIEIINLFNEKKIAEIKNKLNQVYLNFFDLKLFFNNLILTLKDSIYYQISDSENFLFSLTKEENNQINLDLSEKLNLMNFFLKLRTSNLFMENLNNLNLLEAAILDYFYKQNQEDFMRKNTNQISSKKNKKYFTEVKLGEDFDMKKIANKSSDPKNESVKKITVSSDKNFLFDLKDENQKLRVDKNLPNDILKIISNDKKNLSLKKEEVINLILQLESHATSMELKDIKNHYALLINNRNKYLENPKYKKYAELFNNFKVFAATDTFIILVSKIDESVSHVLELKKELSFHEFVYLVFKKKMHIFPVTYDQLNEAKNDISNLKKEKKFPKIKNIERLEVDLSELEKEKLKFAENLNEKKEKQKQQAEIDEFIKSIS